MSDQPEEQRPPDGSDSVSTKWEGRRAKADVVKNWTSVVGLIIGGIWVAWTFRLQSCPSREEQFDGNTELVWAAGPAPDTCVLRWHVTVKNTSARTTRIRRVDVNVWPFRLPTPTGTAPVYVDTEKARPVDRRHYLLQQTFTDRVDPLVDSYAPGAVSDNTFEWVIRRPAATQLVAVEIELYEETTDSVPIWFMSETTEICARPEPTP